MRLIFLATLLSHFAQAQPTPKPSLTATPLNNQVYVHTTYGIYGNSPVPSNGLIVITTDGVVLIDTGWDTANDTDNTRQLLRWIADSLRQPIRLCIITHAHDDKVGGITELRKAGIRVISTPLTAQRAVKSGYPSPDPILPADTTFSVGREPIRCYFPGEGHTSDNVVVWLPNQQILYGGCFVKSVAAFGMGNLADANVKAWSGSIRNVMRQFGDARIVVPGHEEWSDTKALEHTLQLINKHLAAKK